MPKTARKGREDGLPFSMKLWNFSIGMRRNSVYNGRKNRHRSFAAREEVGMAQSVKARHFTEGKLLPLIIKFTIPLMLTEIGRAHV